MGRHSLISGTLSLRQIYQYPFFSFLQGQINISFGAHGLEQFGKHCSNLPTIVETIDTITISSVICINRAPISISCPLFKNATLVRETTLHFHLPFIFRCYFVHLFSVLITICCFWKIQLIIIFFFFFFKEQFVLGELRHETENLVFVWKFWHRVGTWNLFV